jgi:hypothetical protein
MSGPRPRPKRICQRTGFKVPADQLVEDGETNAAVWSSYRDPRHPSRDMPPPRGERVKSDATGEGADRHLEAGEIGWDDL